MQELLTRMEQKIDMMIEELNKLSTRMEGTPYTKKLKQDIMSTMEHTFNQFIKNYIDSDNIDYHVKDIPDIINDIFLKKVQPLLNLYNIKKQIMEQICVQLNQENFEIIDNHILCKVIIYNTQIDDFDDMPEKILNIDFKNEYTKQNFFAAYLKMEEYYNKGTLNIYY